MTCATKYQDLTMLFVEHIIEILGCKEYSFSLLTNVLTHVVYGYVLRETNSVLLEH